MTKKSVEGSIYDIVHQNKTERSDGGWEVVSVGFLLWKELWDSLVMFRGHYEYLE